MECFNGISYLHNAHPFKVCCYTFERVQNGYMTQSGTKYKFLDWIKNFSQDWHVHFLNGPYSSQNAREY